MGSCKISLKPIQSMVIHDLDDEFWGMTWKPPFEWRNTYHTRAEQDHHCMLLSIVFFPPEMRFTRHLLAV